LRGELRNNRINVDIIRPTNIINEYSDVFKITKGIKSEKVVNRIYSLIIKHVRVNGYRGRNLFIPHYFFAVRLIERVFPFYFDKLAGLKNQIVRRRIYRRNSLKKVIITGASSGLGRDLAYLYAKDIDELIVTGRNETALQAVKQDIEKASNCSVSTFVVDFSTMDGVTDLVNKFDNVDMLINNAGSYLNKSIDEMSIDEYEEHMNINFFCPVLLTTRLLKKCDLKKIINILSTAAIAGRRNHSAYSAAKAALWAFTRSLRRIYGNSIQVLEVIPATFNSNLFRSLNNRTIENNMKRSSVSVARKIYKFEKIGRDKVFYPFRVKLFMLFEVVWNQLFNKIFN